MRDWYGDSIIKELYIETFEPFYMKESSVSLTTVSVK